MEPSAPAEATFGKRLRAARERAGKSRTVIGGLVGKSAEWVKAIESGRILTPRLPMLLRLCEVLGIDDLAKLTGSQSLPVASITKAGHDATPTVAEAMRAPARRLDQPPDVAILTGHIDQAWSLWHRSSMERTAIATVLPDLLAETRAAARSHDGVPKRRAHAELVRVYHLAQLFLAFQPVEQLVWLAADRAQQAAEDADDPLAMATAAWYYSHVYRFTAQHEAAEQVARDALVQLDPGRDTEERARWGQLHLAIALANGAAGNAGVAWRHWDQADRAAKALGDGYTHPWLLFGRAALDAYAVQIDADTFQLGNAVRRVAIYDPNALPSRTRRAAYLCQAARAHFLRRDNLATMHLLQRALRESEDTVRHNTFARTVSLELLDGRGPVAEDARELALVIGTIG